jgi:S-adenosylmethionine hydrolase
MTRIVTLLTDFGLQDAYVGVMKGVILGIAPDVAIVGLTHEVPPQQIQAGAFLLMAAFGYFPPGTIHVAVVDPGVGTERKIVAASAGGQTFLGPDNGVVKWAVERAGGASEAVSVESPEYRLPVVSRTFHGRDIIAPAAAHLARGVALAELGPPLAELAGPSFPQPRWCGVDLIGEVVHVDHFGNCVTNLPPEPGDVQVSDRRLPRAETYAGGPSGEPIVLVGSAGFIEIAVPYGSAAAALHLARGACVTLCPVSG